MTMHVCLTHSIMDCRMLAIVMATQLSWEHILCQLHLSLYTLSYFLDFATTFSNKRVTLIRMTKGLLAPVLLVIQLLMSSSSLSIIIGSL